MANSLDSLLHVLDTTINNKARYGKLLENKIDKLKEELSCSSDAWHKSELANVIAREYIVCRTDSALHYSYAAELYAKQSGCAGRIADAAISRASIMRVMGLYKEASELLDSLELTIPKDKLPDYLDTRLSIINVMETYAVTPQIKQHYLEQSAIYRDSLLSLPELHPMLRVFLETENLILKGKYDEGLVLMMECYNNMNPVERNAGIMAYSIAVLFKKKGDIESAMAYFARSAIADICAGVKDHSSLRRLSSIIHEKGDIDRAYSYMKCSLEDASLCNARLTTVEASNVFVVIDEAYQQKEKQRKTIMLIFLVVAIALTLLFLVMLIVIFKQYKKLGRAKDALSQSNRVLYEVNQTLEDSNRIKEEYVGLYMGQYSDYLSKMTSLKNKVQNYTKGGGGDVKGLQSVISSCVNPDDELKQFYQNFDAAILHLFPDFAKQFDELLTPEARGIYTNTNDGLSPTLRIFALIRLGITDSVKIAPFLRYSTTTIYNYRTKMRNLALGERSEFEANVMKIGSMDATQH